MKKKLHDFCRRGQRRTKQRLKRARKGRGGFHGRGRYSVSERVEATKYGGAAALLKMAKDLKLPEAIDAELKLLKFHRPYLESDHILNLAMNALCGGECLQDIERRRNDVAYLDMIGVSALPDPTTAGDFCRRFSKKDLDTLLDAFNVVRKRVWNRMGEEFTNKTAIIDVDSTFVTTTGECTEGIELTYKKTWAHHPLLVTYANTNEVLFLENRPGARPSVEGAPALLDKAVALCREVGHKDILLRGDTAFTQSRYLDGWDDQGVRFVFGILANQHNISRADGLEDKEYVELVRNADKLFREGASRKKPPRSKQQVVEAKGYKDMRLRCEDVAEFAHTPTRSNKSYRVIALRKTIDEYRGQLCLGETTRYFFYITNDRVMTPAEVVRQSNLRCGQEKLIGELKSGVRSLRIPLDTLNANAAYMIATTLAWSLKAWFAMSVPISPQSRSKHSAERKKLLNMSFRRFVHDFVLLPVQIVRSGRSVTMRLLSWASPLRLFLRIAGVLGMT